MTTNLMHRTAARRHGRLAGLAAVIAAGSLALTGCIKVDATVDVAPDATGSGTFGFSMQKDAANFLGMTSLDTFTEGLTSGDLSGGGGIGDFKDCATSETDDAYVYSCTFTNTSFTSETDLWTITKTDEVITFHMASAGDSMGAMQDNPLGETDLGTVTVAVTFPGPITSATGSGVEQTSDTSATISGSMSDQIDVTITAESGEGGGLPALLAVLILVAILVLIVIVAVVLIMRRRKAPHELDAATVVAAEAIEVAPDAVPLTDAELRELETPSGPEAIDGPDTPDSPAGPDTDSEKND